MFGSTGSGKTFTMLGEKKQNLNCNQLQLYQEIKQSIKEHRYNDIGILIYSVMEILKEINKDDQKFYQLNVQYFEIYNENVFDLLGDVQQNLSLYTDEQNEFQIKNITSVSITSLEEVIKIIQTGEANRHYAQTVLNHNSSRSHTIFKIFIDTQFKVQNQTISTTAWINFIDLAGNEKLNQNIIQDKSRLKESQNINKSLFFLTQIIGLLGQNIPNQHIPFRNSILTKILKSSLVGYYKTLLILCVSPSVLQIEQSLSTIKFGENAKLIDKKYYEKPQINPANQIGTLIQNLNIKIEEQENQIEQKNEQISEIQEQINQLAQENKQLYEQIKQKRNLMDNFTQCIPVVLQSERREASTEKSKCNNKKGNKLVNERGNDQKMKNLLIQNKQYKQMIYGLQQRIKSSQQNRVRSKSPNQTTVSTAKKNSSKIICQVLETQEILKLNDDQLITAEQKMYSILSNIQKEITKRNQPNTIHLTQETKDDSKHTTDYQSPQKTNNDEQFNQIIYSLDFSNAQELQSQSNRQKSIDKSPSNDHRKDSSPRRYSNSPFQMHETNIVKASPNKVIVISKSDKKDKIINAKKENRVKNHRQEPEQKENDRSHHEERRRSKSPKCKKSDQKSDISQLTDRLMKISEQICDVSAPVLKHQPDNIIYETESEQNNSVMIDC